MHARSDRDLMKATNRTLLLNILRREGELSRTRLIELSGLSSGAVSGLINELIEEGWLFEAGAGAFTGGRRQTLLRLNPAAGYAIGLKLTEERIIGAITDFNARVLVSETRSLPPNTRQPEAVSEAIIAFIRELLERAPTAVTIERLFGIGIGLAGVIYSAQGIVHHSPFFGWRDVPLTDLLGAHTALPVYLENDVNTLTLSEQLFGAGRHHANFIVATIGRGVGMGMILDHQLYRGARGGAGEFGQTWVMHTHDAHDSRLHAPGIPRTLESTAADPAVVAAYRAFAPAATTLADVVNAADSGDDHARRLLAESGRALGMGLATVVNLLSPDLIIVSGEGVSAGEYRLGPMRAALEQYTFAGLRGIAQVQVVPVDDQAWARGAASLVLSKVFAAPTRNSTPNAADKVYAPHPVEHSTPSVYTVS